MSSRGQGSAPIKAEFLVQNAAAPDIIDDDSAEVGTNHVPSNRDDPRDQEETGEPSAKRPRISGAQKKKLAREEKQKFKGANKNRRFTKVREDVDVCWRIATGEVCPNTDCRFSHDVTAYLAVKPQDIMWHASPPEISSSPPFITPHEFTPSELNPSIDTQTSCPAFLSTGACKHGYKCRFLGGHVQKASDEAGGGLEIVKNDQLHQEKATETTEVNYLSPIALKLLRTKKYPTPLAEQYAKDLEKQNNEEAKSNAQKAAEAEKAGEDQPTAALNNGEPTPAVVPDDTPDVAIRPSEKKRLHWQGMTYLAPLTTVGNLPFRRLCSTLGAEITCSEMALATSLLGSSREEWSLVRRHPSERVFGVQVAGSKPAMLARTAEILGKEFGNRSEGANGIDFVDVNCGCPIDMVFHTGAGSGLLDTPGKLGKILIGMNRTLGSIPLTIKVRTGVKDNKNTSHKLIPRLGEWGVSAFAIHGRSRQQRYTKSADWDYIKQCVDTLRESSQDEDLPPIPIFGGGDVYSSEAYWNNIDQSGVDGIMIGRGALIKPWIFTEIKERREWDISSRERLDLIRQYAEFGLNHWGTDTVGVNTTRRYLCESLSFQHRYVPIGLLEVMPGHINDRPPAYHGRDELETLLASSNSSDWVKISEMFLGPTPEGWTFTPKHKSNAHGSEEGNG